MRGIRLASLLALVLALSGGFAASTRPAPGPRVVTSIAWYQTSPAKRPGAQQPLQVPDTKRGRPAVPVSRVATRVRPVYVTHSLFQRPPPTNSAALRFQQAGL
jgi:hypothetical protein